MKLQSRFNFFQRPVVTDDKNISSSVIVFYSISQVIESRHILGGPLIKQIKFSYRTGQKRVIVHFVEKVSNISIIYAL